MITDTIDRLHREARLPEVDAERCVQTVCADSGCRACVDACPVQAWIMDDDSLGIDTGRCDGCGLCVPACPEGAIGPTYRPQTRLDRGALVAFAACSVTGLGDGEGMVPCLHVFGSGELLALHRDGVRRLILARGDCDQCPRGTVPRLDQRLHDLNRLLASRQQPVLRVVQRTPAEWHRHLHQETDPASGPALGRRDFFRRIAVEAVQVTGDSEPSPFRPVGAWLPPSAEGAAEAPLWPFVPVFRADQCDGCDACVRICPHGALLLESDPLQYRVVPEHCTNCGLCRDVCPSAAIAIEPMAALDHPILPLFTGRCQACGTPLHMPEGRAREDGLCRICAKTNHYRNLYQVHKD